MADEFNPEAEGFTLYSTPSSASDAADEIGGTLYTTTLPDGATAQGVQESATSPASAGPRSDFLPGETVNDHVDRRNREKMNAWERPADWTDAQEDAFQRAKGQIPGQESREEAAAYNAVAGLNLGTQGKAGMTTEEAFESEAQMYTQIDPDDA